MLTGKRLTALAIARAMQSGKPTVRAIVARIGICLGAKSAWSYALAERFCQLPAERRARLSTRALASLVELDEGYQEACRAEVPLVVRRYFLRENTTLGALPLGLHHCQIPDWPNSAALARWLGVTNAGMWRLTRPSAWQRRASLGEQHYRYRLMAKHSGGLRLLEVPHPYLRPLQRRILDDLLDHVPPHGAACAYTRERSVLTHARAHAGKAVVLRFDLQDFFSTVRASRIHALFATLGYPDEVASALTALCTTATPEPVLRRMYEDGSLPWHQLQYLRNPHLPQGAPTSAALANLCCFRVDLRLEGLAHSLGASYTRYADDLVFSGESALLHARARIESIVAGIVAEEGFRMNFRKTRCLSSGRRQTVCSIVVNRQPNLPRDEFDRLKAILHQCVQHGPNSQNRESRPHWRDHLRGRVAWAAQVNPRKAQRLIRLLDAIDWTR